MVAGHLDNDSPGHNGDPPGAGGSGTVAGLTPSGLRISAWNLLLLVPFVSVITPLLNIDHPRLIGMPFLYWSALLMIPVSVLCTVTVHVMTRDRGDRR